MGTNLFQSQGNMIPVRWQTEWEKVGLHISPCVPAPLKSDGLAWRTEDLRTGGEFMPVEIQSAIFEAGK